MEGKCYRLTDFFAHIIEHEGVCSAIILDSLKQCLFFWLVTPQFLYAILFRAVRQAILENLNKKFRANFVVNSQGVKISIKPHVKLQKIITHDPKFDVMS
jgi:hypothetical protein